MTRATVSVGPPAENDTMMRTGLDGYLSSALATAPTSAHAITTAARAASNRSRLPITSLPHFHDHGSADFGEMESVQATRSVCSLARLRGRVGVGGDLKCSTISLAPSLSLPASGGWNDVAHSVRQRDSVQSIR